MQLLDQLEQDYHTIYPEEDPILPEGYEQTLRDLIIPK